MTEDRFSDLSLLQYERDLANIIDSEDVLSKFSQKSYRFNLTLKSTFITI